jgi:antitoxin CptB
MPVFPLPAGERRPTGRYTRFTDMEEARIKRLQWRTRRGTRELDALFGGWLETSFPTADEAQRQAFDELLDVQDPDLWDWVMGHACPPRADWQAIIDDIRARHRL